MPRGWLSIAVGFAAAAIAVAVLLTGGGWWALWIGLIALALIMRPIARRFWERVERDDPASVPLRVMWMSAGWVVVAVVLGVSQLAAIGFRENTGRGLVAFVGAFFFGFAWWKARAMRRRLRAD